MDFLIGALVALAALFVVSKFILSESEIKKTMIPKIVYRQSHLYNLIKPAIDYVDRTQLPITQSYKHEMSTKLRVVFADDIAYWIKDNAFYQADVVDGLVDESTTKVVDTMGMDKVELNKMIFIVQQLTEGMTNDGSSTGF